MYLLLADLVLIIHLAFVIFVLCGGLLVLRWRWIAWLHLPAVVWGAVVEFTGWICPLTPLENWLRAQGGETTYRSDFIAQYLLPVLYPEDLTRDFSCCWAQWWSSSMLPSIGGSGEESSRVVLPGIDRVQSLGQM